jgi:hypothetical protein
MTTTDTINMFIDTLLKYAPNTIITKISEGVGTERIIISRLNSPLLFQIFIVDVETLAYRSNTRGHTSRISNFEHFAKSWAKWGIFDAKWNKLFTKTVLSDTIHFNTGVWQKIKNVLHVNYASDLIENFTHNKENKAIKYTIFGVEFKTNHTAVSTGCIYLDGYKCGTEIHHYDEEGIMEALFPQAAIRQAKLNQLLS